MPADAERAPLFSLPGFLPDAVSFATRTTLALLLAYFVAFAGQVSAASSAGVCVGLVAQPSAGMSLSKARYRMLGTVIGGVVAMLLVSAFPQDRTALLAGFVLWMGACAFVASLLRDFRSYGAGLSGYTVGIIAVAVIDAPQTAMLDAVNRVGAMSIGIGAVLAVNHLSAGTSAFDGLVRALRRGLGAVTALALDALEGRALAHDFPLARAAGAVSRLQTEAVYAAAELPGGRPRADGARHAIAGLMSVATASGAIADALGPETPPAVRTYLRTVAAAIRDPAMPPGPPPRASGPSEALLLERADAVLAGHRDAVRGLRVLAEGGSRVPRARLRIGRDWTGALLGALRTMVAVALGATFCVLGGWSGATMVLILQAAVVTSLNTAPNPLAATTAFALPLVPVVLAVGVVEFLVLPEVSGFVPFALAVAPLMFVAALLSRHARLGRYAGSAMLFVTLLLGPANPQSFDFSAYCNTALQLAIAMAFTFLAFYLVLRDPPRRHVRRIARTVAADLGRTLRDRGRVLDPASEQSLLFDRMARAFYWLGQSTAAQARVVGSVFAMGQVDLAIQRARACLVEAARVRPGLAADVAAARAVLHDPDPPMVLASAQMLLDSAPDLAASGPARGAASAMAEVAGLLAARRDILRLRRRLGE